MANKLKITQIKSDIRQLQKQKATLKALGLRGIRKSVVHEQSPSLKGMIEVVSHLVTVEEV